MENGEFAPKESKGANAPFSIIFGYDVGVPRSLCTRHIQIFHNIFKYLVFQRRQKALLWSKGLLEY